MTDMNNIKNRQKNTARIFWLLAAVFAVTAIFPFMDGNPLSRAWAIAFVSIFLALSSLASALIFARRGRKMNRLLTGEVILARWELDDALLEAYAALQNEESSAKNKAVMWVVGFFFVACTLPLLFFLEPEEMGGFLAIMGAIFLLVFAASCFFPWYYQRRCLKGDRQILVGAKYAYVNGYFHNWDFPLSGLSRVSVMRQPFYGLELSYFYTDRTLRNTHALMIPAPDSVDLEALVRSLRAAN
jgi:hypothetical protein